jgi:S1-C subfamily serine protease
MEPDDGHDDEAPAYRQPPSPDDRLWRHPSEVAPPASLAAPQTRSVWLIGALSAVVGGVLVTGVAAATGVLADHPNRRSEAASTAGVTMAPTVLAAARRARASTVTVEVRTDGRTTRGLGLVFRAGGYVLTNAHLVEGANSVLAHAPGASASPAKVIGVDREFDVAVLKADRVTAPAVVIGSAGGLRAGQMLVAVAPLSDARSSATWATLCTVTGIHRPVPLTQSRLLLDMIETDAPGGIESSGAALLDSTGAVVGIRNGAATRASGGKTGMVTPIDLARVTAEQLAGGGTVHKPWLGIEGTDVDQQVGSELGIKGGAVVGKVLPDSPASAAGFRERDVVVAVDGQPIETMSMLVVVLHLHRPGDSVTIDVLRGKEHQAMKVVLSERR